MRLSKTKLYLWVFIIVFFASCLHVKLSFKVDDVPPILRDARERLTSGLHSRQEKRKIDYVRNSKEGSEQKLLILQLEGGYDSPSKIKNAYVFRRKPETEHLLCGRILSGDEAYIKNLTHDRPKLRERKLNMSCAEVRARILPPKSLKELAFGVAYARIVYEGYEFIEDELRTSFHPQNIFCFSVDAKAKNEFYSNIFALSICLPNVLISPIRYPINSNGENMNQAHYDCLRLLSKHEGWQYVILLQNYDMMIKSVYETVSILEALNGANDIRARPCEWSRWNHTANWNARALKLFRNESLATASQLATNLTIVRGMVQSSISRAAVEWAVNTVDLSTLIKRINTHVHGTDELLWAVLQMSDGLQMPGRFTGKCSKSYVPFITRTSIWIHQKTIPIRCAKYRHMICIVGVEHLQLLSASKYLLANKPLPTFDYAIVDCMHELLFNRTHLGQIDHDLDLQFYKSLENVRYHTNSIHPNPNYTLQCPH